MLGLLIKMKKFFLITLIVAGIWYLWGDRSSEYVDSSNSEKNLKGENSNITPTRAELSQTNQNNTSSKDEVTNSDVTDHSDRPFLAQVETLIEKYDSDLALESEGYKDQIFYDLVALCNQSPHQRCADFFLRELNNTNNPIHIHGLGLSSYLSSSNLEREEKITFLENFKFQKSGELMKEDIDKTIHYFRTRY